MLKKEAAGKFTSRRSLPVKVIVMQKVPTKTIEDVKIEKILGMLIPY